MDFIRKLLKLPWYSPDWAYPKLNRETNELLQQCLEQPNPVGSSDSVDDLIARSNAFPIPFPLDTPRLIKLKETRSLEQLQKNIKSTYTLIHSRVLLLMAKFLMYKRQFGSSIEKEFYKNMTIPEFIDRILKKRAIVFMSARDRYKLLSGESGYDGWESVGQEGEKPPLVLSSCLSYDEMKIAAMVYVSGHTECINDGNRRNAGVPSDNVQNTARIIGLIGPRFKRKGRMDYEDIVISKKQNCTSNGYGKFVDRENAKSMWRQLWAEFYQVSSYTYEDSLATFTDGKKTDGQKYSERFISVKEKDNNVVFDNEVYNKRIRIIAETTLLEANYVAAEEGTSAYLNVVGCGLGVWRISPHQNDVYVITLLERIQNLMENKLLQNVSDVNFAYIKCSRTITALFNKNKDMRIFLKSGDHPKGGINVTLIDREPASRLTDEHENKLLVLTYAWDSNAHPGNEFWIGKLSSSGDPAAACSTQVSELHNAHINSHVNGNNVRVAGDIGIKPMSTYCTEFNHVKKYTRVQIN